MIATLARTVLLVLALLVAGCHDPGSTSIQRPVAILKDDVCAVCGMYIAASPGPRGEAYVEGRKGPLKFDSTRDFFAYVLQPENKLRLQSLFVQDTARIDWHHPSNAADSFIDARTAYYVIWQPLPGSMGPTLASFEKHAAAMAFIEQHGGEVFRFDDVTPELIARLGYTCPATVSRAPGAKQCLGPRSALGAVLSKPEMSGMTVGAPTKGKLPVPGQP